MGVGIIPLYSSYVPQLKISRRVSHDCESVSRRLWQASVWRSSVKMYVPGADMALLMSSATKRGDGSLVVVARCTKGWRAARAFVCD